MEQVLPGASDDNWDTDMKRVTNHISKVVLAPTPGHPRPGGLEPRRAGVGCRRIHRGTIERMHKE